MKSSAICTILFVLGCNATVVAQDNDARQQAILKRIYRFGDAETRRGKVYLAAMRDATDEDLSVLKDIPDVVSLDIAYNKTDGSALVHLAAMKRLRWLWLHNNRIKDQHLKHIRRLSNLRRLDACHTQIGDVGLHTISQLSNLEVLCLDDTNVSDAGLIHIAKLKKLRQLWLANTYVTRAGIERLKKAMPKTRIWYYPWKPVEAKRPNHRGR
jgi:hypothetical protein